MIIERENRKYWCPDDVTSLDANGIWHGISNDVLVPYDLYILQEEKKSLEKEMVNIANETTDTELIAWARENNPIFQRQSDVETRLAELDLAITNHGNNK